MLGSRPAVVLYYPGYSCIVDGEIVRSVLQRMASFSITPLTEHTGAEVLGFDFRKPVEREGRAALNRAFVTHHVLIMRDQHFTPNEFRSAARLFGELQPHDKKEHHVPDHPDVSYVSNDEFVNGRRIIPGETFHTDHSNHPRPPKATTLFAVTLPSRGGDTQYVNMHKAMTICPPKRSSRSTGSKRCTCISANIVSGRSAI